MQIFKLPSRIFLSAAYGEALQPLSAFDTALHKIGIADVNLVRITSIIPVGTQLVDELPPIPAGSVVPAVYTTIFSSQNSQCIAAAIGLGFSYPDKVGIIMEHSGYFTQEHAVNTVKSMIEYAFKIRNLPLLKVKVESVEHIVEGGGCCVAIAVFI